MHISPPRGSASLSSSPISDNEKPSGLNQKTLGVTNRIWAILTLFLALFILSRFILPSDPSSSHRHPHGYTDTSHLVPINYMNFSDSDPGNGNGYGGSPFAFCPLYGPGDVLGAKHGIHALEKSRVHSGSGARVQRVIHKALSGLPVTISVLGGSGPSLLSFLSSFPTNNDNGCLVSACHGAGDDPISPKCYPARFFAWWNSVFPHPASELTNGAMRRTNSAYFSFCNAHHLPDQTDLVILEFDVDDPLCVFPTSVS